MRHNMIFDLAACRQDMMWLDLALAVLARFERVDIAPGDLGGGRADRFFDFTTDGKNKPLLKQMTKLQPKKQSNPLYANLVALKVNIAASALGKIPVGYGDLIFDRDSIFSGQVVSTVKSFGIKPSRTAWKSPGRTGSPGAG